MSKFVDTYPPPPRYYQQFRDENFVMTPPPVVELDNKEIYGGSLLFPAGNQDNFDSERDYRKDLKRCLREFMVESLRFVCDENRGQPFNEGAIAIETKSAQFYNLLSEYRSHEAREKICVKMRQQVAELQELKTSLSSTLEEATAMFNIEPVQEVTVQERALPNSKKKIFFFKNFETSFSCCDDLSQCSHSSKELAVISEPSGDKILREISCHVAITPSLLSFMYEFLLPTMYKEGGIGIASVQVSLPINVLIIDIPLVTFINGTRVLEKDSDPRYVRNVTEAGKIARVTETRPVYEYSEGGDYTIRHITETRIISIGSSPDITAPDLEVTIERKPIFVINPEVEFLSEEMIVLEEGCLSVPKEYVVQMFGTNTRVERPNGIRMRYTDEMNTTRILHADGNSGEHCKWVVRCVLHEIDHLHGVLFTDKLYTDL